MSVSSSDVTDGGVSADTGGSSVTDISGTNMPLVLISAYKDEQARNNNKHILQPLPSGRYKFTNWHEVQEAKIKGNELRAPRVRETPAIKEQTFHSLKNNQGALIHHGKKGKERKDYRNEMENWENAEFCNLSYQNLSDSFQKKNLMRILKRLIRVVELNLMQDLLTDLHSLSFPCCKMINLTGNHLDHFNKLPKMPQIEQLTLAENNIASLDGIHVLSKTPLYQLDLSGNPLTFLINYRPKVFQALPQLKVLDNIPKLPSDDELDEPESKSCVIS